jgi:hypothetical protein
MIELIKGLIYIEIGADSVLCNAKWLLVVGIVLVQCWLIKRTIMSFRRRA